jgi:cobalt-zinc-cadmium efflux system outer membrane protein
MMKKIYINMLVLLIAGCSSQSPHKKTSYDFSYISEGIQERTDYTLKQVKDSKDVNFPQGVSLEDGLSENEAVAIALWNNAQFQADLTALGFARADLIKAGMLANPVFSLLFPVGPKLLETSLDIPIDILWQRPHRIAAAKVDAQSLSENLIEHGLGLIRDVQTTYIDLWLAQEQVRLAEEDAQLRVKMAKLAKGRLKAGDISELEASAVYIDSLQATDVTRRFSKEAIILKQRLTALLGLIADNTKFDIIPLDIDIIPAFAAASLSAQKRGSDMSVDELLKIALAARPDLRAAELKIEAAGKRLGWEKSKVYNLIAIIDAKDEGEDFLTTGPGLSTEVPIFNQNNGEIARAKAELEQATRQYEAVRQNIILQVRQAHTQYVSALEEFELWHSDIIPNLEKASEQAQKSFEAGEVSYFFILEAKRKLLEACMRKTEFAADLHRSAAQLNYCIGKRMIETESSNFVKLHE